MCNSIKLVALILALSSIQSINCMQDYRDDELKHSNDNQKILDKFSDKKVIIGEIKKYLIEPLGKIVFEYAQVDYEKESRPRLFYRGTEKVKSISPLQDNGFICELSDGKIKRLQFFADNDNNFLEIVETFEESADCLNFSSIPCADEHGRAIETSARRGSITFIAAFDDKTIVTASEGLIKVWKTSCFCLPIKYQKTLFGEYNIIDQDNLIKSFLAMPNGDVISGLHSGLIKVWKTSFFCNLLQEIPGHRKSVNALNLLENEKFVSGSDDCTIRIWKKNKFNKKYECERIIDTSASIGSFFLLSKDILISAGGRNSINVWDIKTGECLKSFDPGQVGDLCIKAICFLPNGKLVTSDGIDMKIWDFETGKCICTKKNTFVTILYLLYNRHLLTVCDDMGQASLQDNGIKIWVNT